MTVDSELLLPPEFPAVDRCLHEVRLAARGDSPLTRLTVFDGRFHEVGRGLGRLDLLLPVGLYKVEFRIGNIATFRHVALTGEVAEARVSIEPADLPIPSAAPLPGSLDAVEIPRDIAVKLSHSARRALVHRGAQVLVLLSDPQERQPAVRDLFRGMSLHDSAGASVGQIASIKTGPSFAGVLLKVGPGTYRLRAKEPSGRIFEQAVTACEGWQTQVFLKCPRSGELAVDLFHSSVYLARIEDGFDPSRRELRWVEQARLSLAQGGDIFAGLPSEPGATGDGNLRALFNFASPEPMLLLLCIYLLLRAPLAGPCHGP